MIINGEVISIEGSRIWIKPSTHISLPKVDYVPFVTGGMYMYLGRDIKAIAKVRGITIEKLFEGYSKVEITATMSKYRYLETTELGDKVKYGLKFVATNIKKII